MTEIQSSGTSFGHFHCPLSICSSIAHLADVDTAAVKLVCSLRHVYWVPIKDLRRVDPYWPDPLPAVIPSTGARIEYNGELYWADENCDHYIVHADGGGVRCTKCRGWFCW